MLLLCVIIRKGTCPDAGVNSKDNYLADSSDTRPSLQPPTHAASNDPSCPETYNYADESSPANPDDTWHDLRLPGLARVKDALSPPGSRPMSTRAGSSEC